MTPPCSDQQLIFARSPLRDPPFSLPSCLVEWQVRRSFLRQVFSDPDYANFAEEVVFQPATACIFPPFSSVHSVQKEPDLVSPL